MNLKSITNEFNANIQKITILQNKFTICTKRYNFARHLDKKRKDKKRNKTFVYNDLSLNTFI
jgi:hypothetical protein